MFISLFTIVKLDELFEKHNKDTKLFQQIYNELLNNNDDKILKNYIKEYINDNDKNVLNEFRDITNNIMISYINVFEKLYASIQKLRNMKYKDYVKNHSKIENIFHNKKYINFMKKYPKTIKKDYINYDMLTVIQCKKDLDDLRTKFLDDESPYLDADEKCNKIDNILTSKMELLEHFIENQSDIEELKIDNLYFLIQSILYERSLQRDTIIQNFTKNYELLNNQIKNLFNIFYSLIDVKLYKIKI